MRPWPERLKQTLRHLAAARYFLPAKLVLSDGTEGADLQYQEFLHQAECSLALDELVYLGEQHPEDPFQPLFWEELALAAQNMNMQERALEFKRRVDASRGEAGAI